MNTGLLTSAIVNVNGLSVDTAINDSVKGIFDRCIFITDFLHADIDVTNIDRNTLINYLTSGTYIQKQRQMIQFERRLRNMPGLRSTDVILL